mmetsp:Transcript_55632/g.169246  ORF Transcript_55632/g.169246 Transcript_55632/m.169246 type:complete len:264 (+) Transcript_55632:386-1177(+)
MSSWPWPGCVNSEWPYITMSMMACLAASTPCASPAMLTLCFLLAAGPSLGTSGMLTSTLSSSFSLLMTEPCLPIMSGKFLGCTLTKFSAKESNINWQYPFSAISLMAFSASCTPGGGPVIVKTSPIVSIFVCVLSWSNLIVLPWGPIAMPTLFSGTTTWAVEVGASGSLASTSTFFSMIFAMSALIASSLDWFTATLPLLWPLPPEYQPPCGCSSSFLGYVACDAPLVSAAFSSLPPVFFFVFLDMLSATSHAGPVPSSIWIW